MQLKTLVVASHFMVLPNWEMYIPQKWLMTDGRWYKKVDLFCLERRYFWRYNSACGGNCRYSETSSDQLLTVEWTYPNGTSPHTWGTDLRAIPLHILYKYPVSLRHTFCVTGKCRNLQLCTSSKSTCRGVCMPFQWIRTIPTKYGPLEEIPTANSPPFAPS